MKILAAIITHNRSKLLMRCLYNVENQSRKPNDILVVNNGSTDDTVNLLYKKKINFISQDNLGSAGGWFTALEYSIKNNYDYCWLMDDDGYPKYDALKILEGSLDNNTSCISSAVVEEKKKINFVFPLPILNKKGMPVIFSLKRKIYNLKNFKSLYKNYLYPYAHLFNGALISMNAIKKIGNVNREYFIYGDELDLFYRLRDIGFVYTNINALHFHPSVNNTKLNELKIYYFIKNTIIINQKFLDYPMLRSLLTVVIILFRVGKRNGLIYLLKLLLGSRKLIFYKAIYRGYKKKIGKDFEN